MCSIDHTLWFMSLSINILGGTSYLIWAQQQEKVAWQWCHVSITPLLGSTPCPSPVQDVENDSMVKKSKAHKTSEPVLWPTSTFAQYASLC